MARDPGIRWAISSADSFDASKEAWDSLVQGGRFPAFMSSDFIGPAIHLLGGRESLLAIGMRGEEPQVATVLQHKGLGRWRTFQPSQLPLGAWVHIRGCDWVNLLNGLMRALPGIVMGIEVTQQDPWLSPRPASTAEREVLDYVPTAWIDVTGAYEDFWQKRGKNLRQNLRKQLKRIEGTGSSLIFEFLESTDECSAALRQFADLESAGWKGDQGTAVRLDNIQGQFYSEVLRRRSPVRGAFALRLSIDGRPVAVDFGVQGGATAVILKTAYDESLKGISPGQLLHERAFEWFFRSGRVKRIEFFGRVMDWHTRWTDTSRMLYHVNQYRSAVVHQGGRLLRRLSVLTQVPEFSEGQTREQQDK